MDWRLRLPLQKSRMIRKSERGWGKGRRRGGVLKIKNTAKKVMKYGAWWKGRYRWGKRSLKSRKDGTGDSDILQIPTHEMETC